MFCFLGLVFFYSNLKKIVNNNFNYDEHIQALSQMNNIFSKQNEILSYTNEKVISFQNIFEDFYLSCKEGFRTLKLIKEKHPLAIRWAHWINFPVLMLMIWSGMLIYWANDVYTVTIFGHTFFNFFPGWLNKALNIPFRLAEGMAFHFLFMWLFAINGFLYVLYTAFSGEWRKLLPNRHSFFEAWQVLLALN